MNKIIKRITCIIGITLLFSFIIFKIYKSKEEKFIPLHIIQIGAYKSYDNVIKRTRTLDNYIIGKEDELYKIYTGITLSDEVYDKLISTYGFDETFKKTIKITNKEFINKIKEFDKVILNTDNKNNLNIIIKEELKLLNNILNKQEII